MESIEALNKRLAEYYGYRENKQRFRLVWANDEREKRWGVFEDFVGDIFIRQVSEVREVPKYPFAKNRYVLEVLASQVSSEVMNHNGYEPVFVFDNNGIYLDPVWTAIEFIIHAIQQPVEKDTPAELERQEERRFNKEVEDFKIMLENQSPTLAGMLKDGEAITVPGMPGQIEGKEA